MKPKLFLLIIISEILSCTIYAQDFWVEITNPCLSSYTNSMFVTSTGRIIASGDCNAIPYSDNNGTNWTFGTGFTGSYETLNKFAVSTNGTIYSATSKGVWKATNNGANWVRTDTVFSVSQDIRDIAINSNNQLYIVSSDGIIFRSTDMGVSWDTVSASFTYPPAISIAINSANTIFVGTNIFNTGGQIYRSMDNGATWTAMAGSIFTNSSVKIIKLNTNDEIFVGTSGNGIYRSLDNGVNWTDINAGITGSSNWISDMIVRNSSNLFICVEGTGVFRSSDKGNTWSDISSGLQTSSIEALAINPLGYLFAGSNDNGTYRSAFSTGVGIDESFLETIVANIFPNPATNSISIETENGKGSYQLHDITGKLLLSGNVTATKFILDISTFSKGIYFLSLFDGERWVNGKIVKE